MAMEPSWRRNQVGDGTKLATKPVGIGDSNVASLFTEPFEWEIGIISKNGFPNSVVTNHLEI